MKSPRGRKWWTLFMKHLSKEAIKERRKHEEFSWPEMVEIIHEAPS